MTLLEQRVIPFLAGHGEDDGLDDLVLDAVRQARVRFRANAWGLGLYNLGARLDLDPALYLWGRPFFVTADTPEAVAETVVRYTKCTPEEVDDLARSQIAQLDPHLLNHIEPDMTGNLPSDGRIAFGLVLKLDALREAAQTIRAGRSMIRDRSGNAISAADALNKCVQFHAVEFLAALLPGWITRGRVWPTEFDAPLSDNAPVFGSLPTEFPGLDWTSDRTINTNYEIGGYSPPGEVRGLREWLSDNASTLTIEADKWNDRFYVRKLDEALALTGLTGSAFVEATDIYIPSMGTIN
ncbi:hypothetical protein ACWDOP_03525 [Nocardia sp. NPDC003693]